MNTEVELNKSDQAIVDPLQRHESDKLGSRALPLDVYYGIKTLRALEHFPIMGIAVSQYPELIKAIAATKQAAAITNRDLGLLSPVKAGAVARRH